MSLKLSTSDPDDDKVHPQHYKGAGGMEVIDVLEMFGLTNNFYISTAVKYLMRCGKKAGESLLVDLKKARWYIDRQIQVLEEKSKPNDS